MSQQLDPSIRFATKAFEGYVVRKDLRAKFKGQYPVPTTVAEFLLGPLLRLGGRRGNRRRTQDCPERQLGEKTIRAGEHELLKPAPRTRGR